MIGLRELAGGVICTGFHGVDLDRAQAGRLRRLGPAGVILFSRNTHTMEQTRRLTDRIRETLEQPIIAIDQEGGRIMRLRNGVGEIPSMRDLAEYGDLEFAVRTGEKIGAGLRSAGVNLNFAPVLDLALLPSNTVIGDRSFGGDPGTVTKFGAAVAIGMGSHGIMPTYKHFPGHGSTDVDSHAALPAIDVDETTLRSRDLIPFFALLPGAGAVMTAHIVVRALDDARPATLSSRILSDLLRDEIGFSGVCFTDCLEMDAIAKNVGTVRGAVEALAAGADCVLVSHRLDLAEECAAAICAAVENGALPAERLHQAYDRVQRLRANLC